MSGMRFEITVNNIEKTLKEKDAAVARALEAIGIQAEKYVKGLTPVDTGRLRGSMTYKTASGGGGVESPAKKKDGVQGKPTPAQVFIGTNVEYAPYVELGAQGRTPVHMIKRGVGDHMSEYKKIIESELESGQ